MVLKDLLQVIEDNCIYIQKKNGEIISSDSNFHNVFPYLDKKVLKVTTNGYEYITIVLDV